MKSGGINYIALAIPVFFLLIGVELLFSRLLRRRVYRVNDSVNDLSCGVIQQVYGAFVGATLFAGYVYVFEHHRVWEIPTSSVWAWVALFVGVDFFYYWFHRASHGVNLLWAAHVVHHQSEEYNLAVALRQAAFQPSFSWLFYLPLALVGFPPLMYGAMVSINTLYQFWIHTRLIGRMGPLEWVLNTPSHHRVHHGRNPKYIDRNHAGTLIIWDRMFGTFEPEQEEPTYGITQPLQSWNPVWANFYYFAELLRLSKQATRWTDKARVWFARPGWVPEGATPSAALPLDAVKYDPPVRKGLGVYAIAQFAPLVPATMAFLQYKSALEVDARLAAGLFFVTTMVALGGLLDGRRWAVPFEAARLGVLVLGAVVVGLRVPGLMVPITVSGLGFALISGAWLARGVAWAEIASESSGPVPR